MIITKKYKYLLASIVELIGILFIIMAILFIFLRGFTNFIAKKTEKIADKIDQYACKIAGETTNDNKLDDDKFEGGT